MIVRWRFRKQVLPNTISRSKEVEFHHVLFKKISKANHAS